MFFLLLMDRIPCRWRGFRCYSFQNLHTMFPSIPYDVKPGNQCISPKQRQGAYKKYMQHGRAFKPIRPPLRQGNLIKVWGRRISFTFFSPTNLTNVNREIVKPNQSNPREGGWATLSPLYGEALTTKGGEERSSSPLSTLFTFRWHKTTEQLPSNSFHEFPIGLAMHPLHKQVASLQYSGSEFDLTDLHLLSCQSFWI